MISQESGIYAFRAPMGVPVFISMDLPVVVIMVLTMRAQTPEHLLWGAVFLGLVLVSVFLHELGHAWGAWVQGIAVERIVLHGFGGYCQHRGATTMSEREFIVSTGPLVNLALWALAALAAPYAPNVQIEWILETLSYVNLFMFFFNMLPLVPLDGSKLCYHLFGRLLSEPWTLRLCGLLGIATGLIFMVLVAASLSGHLIPHSPSNPLISLC